jgi:DNA-binding NtrC family response regulator
MSPVPNVLVLAADQQLGDVFRFSVQDLDAEVDVRTTSSEALAAASEHSPAVAFVDVTASSDGLNRLVSKLRNVDGCSQLPICVMGWSGDAVEAQANGCAFLPLPVSLLTVRDVIRGLLSSHSSSSHTRPLDPVAPRA